MMIFQHENNILTKAKSNYKGLQNELNHFHRTTYLPLKKQLLELDFTKKSSFDIATHLIENYLITIERFAKKYKITSQSKFRSSFLEEINTHLFHNLPQIRGGQLNIFNKGIYSGLKINDDMTVSILKKDVDFCIGARHILTIDSGQPNEIILPLIAVEIKTYLDATMFGEVQFTSKRLKNALPDVRTYVLMEYKSIADEHIIAARQDNALNEMFVLRRSESEPISKEVLIDYYKEAEEAISSFTSTVNETLVPGRLLNR